MSASTTINVLFVISLALTVMKASGLVLRPHQRKVVDDKLESATLWLDYRRPIQWLRRQSFSRQFNKLLLLGIIELFVAFAVLISGVDHKRFLDETLTASENAYLVLSVLIASVAIWSSVILVLRLFPLKWALWVILIGCIPFVGPLWRILSTYQSSLVSLVSYVQEGELICTLKPELNRLVCIEFPWTFGGFLASFALLVLGQAALILMLVGEAAIGTILVASFFLIGEVALSMARVVMWRVVEYEKGAFAALLVLATVLLGILKLYLDRPTP